MSRNRGCVFDETSNHWPLCIEDPTPWVDWLNGFDQDPSPLVIGSMDTLPLAGVAGDHWTFSTLAQRGDSVGVLELAIEANKKGAFHSLMDALQWDSLSILQGTGDLAGHCLLASLAFHRPMSFMAQAGLEMARRGAHAPWRSLCQHSVFCSLPAKMLREETCSSSLFELDGDQPVRLPFPMAMILDANLGALRHDILDHWTRSDVESLGLACFPEGPAAGGGILHACVWGQENLLLQRLLRTPAGALTSSVDNKGRTPLRLAVELGAHSCEKDLRTYNGRRIAEEAMRQMESDFL